MGTSPLHQQEKLNKILKCRPAHFYHRWANNHIQDVQYTPEVTLKYWPFSEICTINNGSDVNDVHIVLLSGTHCYNCKESIALGS